MSKYLVNGRDVSTLIDSTGSVLTLSGYSNFPVANISGLTSNFELQKTGVYLNNGTDILKTNKYKAYITNYTSSQTVNAANRPVWANHMNVYCVGGSGGGGGGGNASGNRSRGGGSGGAGGSGGYIATSNATPIPVAPNETIEITVGAGGAAGNAGNIGNAGGKGGATVVAMKLANIKLIADSGAGGNGGFGGGTNDGAGGSGGAGGWTLTQTYNGDTYNGPIQTYHLYGATGNPGVNGFFSAQNANGGAGVSIPMSANDKKLYPENNILSGAGGAGGWSGSGRFGYNANPGNTGYVRIYWLASNNTL